MSEPRAVIFDMDGVLVDTYLAHYESWRIMAAERGLAMTEGQFAATFGRTSREVIAAVWPNGFGPDDIRAMDERKESVFRQLIAEQFPLMPGVLAMLEALRAAGYLLAVGSSGPPENVDTVLDRLGQRHWFGAVVTGRDVTRGKPDPQVFLTAARRLGVMPDRCVVVEDAPAGIQAAHAGGMLAIGIASTGRTAAQLAAAELVVAELSDITPPVVDQLLAAHAGRIGGLQ